ncbi:hypothetical protein PR048_026254 [Dryococelus australis]|uniref:Uncharacterized protein n=1 Tax=Dryococelus australis TaxID=614101 RepID=A0ABQ9GKT7_9NEOP|nr:hypothetical protein PR048_026254 [Dryococelus australis]
MGVCDKILQKEMLQTRHLTLEHACELATLAEVSQQQTEVSSEYYTGYTSTREWNNHVCKYCGETQKGTGLALQKIYVQVRAELAYRKINSVNKLHEVIKWHEMILIEDVKLDTGSEVNIIPETIFNKVNRQFKVRNTSETLECYGVFTIKS